MVYEKVQAAKFRVKYKDFFHMKHLYMMMHQWLVEHDWCDEDANFGEIMYCQRMLPGMNTELVIWWRFEKFPAKKGQATPFIKYYLEVNFKVVLLKDAEIVHQGQKFSTNWGDCDINVSAYLKTDYSGGWEKHWLLKNIQNIFRGRIARDLILKHRIELYREAYRFQEAIKSYWELKTYLPEPEDQAGLYFPRKGVGEA